MTLIRKTINVKAPLTNEQLIELDEASKKSIIVDDECPEITEAEFAQFAEIAQKRREERKNPIVSIRLSPDTLDKAKKLGKGYTGILSRVIDKALNSPEFLRECL